MNQNRAGAEKMTAPDAKRRADFATRLLRGLGSVKFALIILSVLAVVCVLGTLLPQNGEVQEHLELHPEAKGRMAILGFMGLTHVFRALWFRLLLGLLGASLILCTWRRIRTIIRGGGKIPTRLVGSMMTHFSILLILVGAVIRSGWGERGYLTLREGMASDVFFAGEVPNTLPFTVELVDFEIETYDSVDGHEHTPEAWLLVHWRDAKNFQSYAVATGMVHEVKPPPDAATGRMHRVTVLRYVPDFSIDRSTRQVTSRSSMPLNPALQVKVDHEDMSLTQWLFARHPEFNMHGEAAGLPFEMRFWTSRGLEQEPRGPIKDFKSHLKVHQEGKVVAEKTIEVNDPLRYGGYSLYQSSYQGTQISTLQVARDPGVPVVYAGFVLMIAGLFVTFLAVPAGAAPKNASATKERIG